MCICESLVTKFCICKQKFSEFWIWSVLHATSYPTGSVSEAQHRTFVYFDLSASTIAVWLNCVLFICSNMFIFPSLCRSLGS